MYVVCTILIELKKAHIPQKASNSSEEEKHCDFLVKHFHDVFSMPLGVLLVMETPKDECYIVIKAYKFTVTSYPMRDLIDGEST